MENEQAPTGEEQQEQQKDENRAQERIQELARRNKELENIINMQKRLDNTEGTVQQVAQGVQQIAQIQQQQQNANKQEDPWTPFMKPKVQPLLEEAMQPVRHGFRIMGDQIDYLKTMLNHPEFKDPEVQQEVENIRIQRERAGNPESRENIIIYLKGLGKIKSPTGAQSGDSERQEKPSAAFVETGAGVGQTRAATKPQKSAENSSVEEMEKWAHDNPDFKF